MANPTTRVLALLELLQSQGQISGRELAQRLEVDGRTLRRYISTLEELGIPLTSERGRHGGYRLVAGFKLPPMMFTVEEAQAIALGLLAAGSLGLAETTPAVLSAQAKLQRVLPANLQQRVRALSESTTLDLPPSRANGDNRLLLALADAAQARQRVRLSYRSDRGEVSQREVDPYGLVYRWGLWYMSGLCHLRQGLRSFRLDRVQAVQPLEQRFARPAEFDAAGHLNASIANLPRAFPVEVQLHTDLHSATLELGSSVGLLVPNPDGVRLNTRTDSLTWFARQLARLPFDFEVHQPPELRGVLREQARRLLRLAR
ncbi:YafY family transcriptional regulator [Pseudomonas lalucatii]|uniref:YafY family transcriptional regulator n=1 Tax=Pseudomonas lalucatii TaxID=1424203 RepID=A0ABS5Q0I7_9PSED|nr:YafY family protein [Pseudomonas lalucatii]MBS7661846.1 YafY family transcriptional regulator [Pseudomonas lalucatii]